MYTTTTRISSTDCEDSRTTVTAVTTTTLSKSDVITDHINELQEFGLGSNRAIRYNTPVTYLEEF